MSRPRHHRVPKQDLKRFTGGRTCFYYLDKNRDVWRIDYRNPESVMNTRGYYELQHPEAGEDRYLPEIQLQQSEDRAGRSINDVLDQVRSWNCKIPEDCPRRRLETIAYTARLKCPISLNPQDAEILKRYVLSRSIRTHTRDGVEDRVCAALASEVTEIFGQKALEKVDIRTQARDELTRIIGKGITPRQSAVISKMALVVSVSIGPSIAPFVIGDVGSLKCIPEGKHLWDQGSGYFMPVSSDTGISIVPGTGVQLEPILDRGVVRSINEAIFFMSREVACRDKKILQSLMRAFQKGALSMQKHGQRD